MRIILLLIIGFTFSLNTKAQMKERYWLSFKDKNEQEELLKRPVTFLSSKSIERRRLQGIEVNNSDLPVSTIYLNQIKNLGIDIIFASRWFNMVSVDITKDQIRAISGLKFIQKVTRQKGFYKDVGVDELNNEDEIYTSPSLEDYYGLAKNQIEMINGIGLHDQGYKGQGMLIGVLDAGFYHADSLPVFSTAWNDNRITIGPDFVRGNDTLVDFSHSSHGTMVLGFMASELPETYVGTAPEASYILIRTENAVSEDIVEEHYWLQGAEYADSLGVDLINSSLGYTTFDDSLQNHSYEDLDGNTTLITKAADMAASKGILVVSSAGNSGAQSWHFISAPADADSVMTVGSVNEIGDSSPFSSHGPTSDNRVKPNIVGQGQGIFTVSVDSAFYPSQGTSFSAPVLTGMAACLWQYKRAIVSDSIDNMEIITLIENSSTLFPFSNADMGYGIPNFGLATAPLSLDELEDDGLVVFPNPFENSIMIESAYSHLLGYELMDIYGRIVVKGKLNSAVGKIEIQVPFQISQGNYILRLKTENGDLVKKLIK